MSIRVDRLIFSGILGILLILGFFVSVPFHKDFTGLDTLGIIQILLAVFLAVVIYGFDYFAKKREEFRKNERKRKAHNMIRRILIIQRDLIDRLEHAPDEMGRAAFTNQRMSMRDFVRMTVPLNNSEISQIQSSYSDIFSEILVQRILDFVTHVDFLFTAGSEITDIGIENIRITINQLIQNIDEELAELE